MLTSKQRAYLRGLASEEPDVIQIGKGGISENLVIQVKDALKARELIKIKVLDNALMYPIEVATELAEATGSEIVQTIGSKLVLYKRNVKDTKILFPGEKPPKPKTLTKPCEKAKARAKAQEKAEQEKKRYYKSYGQSSYNKGSSNRSRYKK